MRIAVFTDTYHPNVNGVVNTLARMEAYFNQCKIAYKMFYPGEKKAQSGSHRSFTAHPFPIYPEIRVALMPYIVFKAEVDAFSPDVLHIVTEGPMGMMAQRYAKDTGIPFIASYTTDLSQYLNYYRLEILTSLVNRHLIKLHGEAFTNLVPSGYSMDQMAQWGLKNVTLWGRGVDTNMFNPSHRDETCRQALLDGRELLLMYCGRLAKEKKLDILMDMMGELNRESLPVKLILVGDGPYREELERRNVENITFLGVQKGDMLAKLYASSDLFVFASENETYGNVILESLASGLPVVAANEGGVKENLKDGENGIAVSQNTGRCFADVVKKLFADKDERNRLGSTGYADVQDRSWDALFGRLQQLYQEAVNDDEQDQVLRRMA